MKYTWMYAPFIIILSLSYFADVPPSELHSIARIVYA